MISRAQWAALLSSGALVERHIGATVIISCGQCPELWERARSGDRFATIEHRKAAHHHVAHCHPQEFRAAERTR